MKSFKNFRASKEPKYHNVYIGKSFDKPLDNQLEEELSIPRESNTKEMKQTDAEFQQHFDYGPQGHPHRDAIIHYTAHHYQPINKALYEGKPAPAPKYAKVITHLKSAIRKHTTPKDIVVHSGLKPENDPRQFESEGGIIRMHMPAFTSTSLSSGTARYFAEPKRTPSGGSEERHVMHIHVPAGSHGAYVEHLTYNPGEREFILHPKAKIHVDATPEVEDIPASNILGPSQKIYHWRARLVHDGVKEVGQKLDEQSTTMYTAHDYYGSPKKLVLKRKSPSSSGGSADGSE